MMKVAIVKGVIASYSQGFFDRLFKRKDLSVKVYCQDRIRGLNLKTIHHKYPQNVTLLNFISFNKEKWSFQFIPWKEILTDYDVVFVEGNPRNLSHFLFASYLRVRGKKVVLWTMAHSFRGNAITENLRLIWSKFFKFLLLYTEFEVDFLRQKGFKSNYMLGQNNGLDQRKIDESIAMWPEEKLRAWQINNNIAGRTLLLSCARLDPKNQFNQLVLALPEIIKQYPDLLWCIIGTGTEEAELKSLITSLNLTNNVYFVGGLYNEEDLAPWFLCSEIFVHPAAIGLSILHAFGYGLPVVTHGNVNRQNPEYAAFESEKTGRNFEENNINSLSTIIISLLHDREARMKMKRYTQKIAREEYNVDIMVERFIKIATKAYTS